MHDDAKTGSKERLKSFTHNTLKTGYCRYPIYWYLAPHLWDGFVKSGKEIGNHVIGPSSTTMNPLIQILLVDDHTLLRSALRRLISAFAFCRNIYEASNGKEAIAIMSAQEIDLILLDVQMPVLNGLETMKELRHLQKRPKVIVLTQFDEQSLILHMLKLGANGFLLKNCNPHEMESAIRAVMNDGHYFSDFVLRVISENMSGQSAHPNLELSRREHQVLELLKDGKSSKDISNILDLSVLTVETYRKGLLRKTNSQNIAELISLAYRTGLVTGTPDSIQQKYSS